MTNFTISLISELINRVSLHHTDGPKVNLKFHNDLHDLLKNSGKVNDPPLTMNSGTCSLHIVHNAFKMQ